jgi:hypothetical protein
MGNSTPLADLMVVSPGSKTMFLIDVKGQYKKNPWVVRRQPDREGLFYVFAFVPDAEANRFFVLPQTQVNRYIEAELRRLKRRLDYSMTGVLWKQLARHEDRWADLPA